MTAIAGEKRYLCPGEVHPISRAVHLSRLAAFYPKCRDCALNCETGEFTPKAVTRDGETESSTTRESLFTAEGIRGVYLNELTREKAGRIAAVVAQRLWSATPRSSVGGSGTHHSSPLLVIGHDERPSSPDLMAGVTASLLRMGCRIIDVRLVSTACFRFAVDHLQAAAGIRVTGGGCDPSWTGLDLVAQGGRPLTAGAGLEEIEADIDAPVVRPTRRPGSFRTFQAGVPYEASLWKHFHALRPLKIALGCASTPVRQTLRGLFAELPCEIAFVDLPVRARDLDDADDPDIERVATAVRRSNVHLGLLIDDDGCRCRFFDETGDVVEADAMARLIGKAVLAEHPDGGITTASTASRVFDELRDRRAIFGAENNRYWFAESPPTCDAVLTLAKVLEVLSQSDRGLSEVVMVEDDATSQSALRTPSSRKYDNRI